MVTLTIPLLTGPVDVFGWHLVHQALVHYLFPGAEEELLGGCLQVTESPCLHLSSFKDSTIVTSPHHVKALMEWLPGKTFHLLYRASAQGWLTPR